MRIMILVNKDFEYAGYRAGVAYQMARHRLPSMRVVSSDAGIGPKKFTPSCVYELKKGEFTHEVTEFCINYMFGAGEKSSHSQKKYEILRNFIGSLDEKPDLIVSVSTSESTPDAQERATADKDGSVNGCVYIGHRFFAKDCRGGSVKSDSNLYVRENWNECNGEISSLIKVFDHSADIQDGMTQMPNNPAKDLFVDANPGNFSLGVINVTEHKDYEEADPRAYEAYMKLTGGSLTPVSLETTHAVVKMAAGTIPVIFVSPTVDRYHRFAEDVGLDSNWGSQNRIGSFNAGVVVGNILEHLADKLSAKFPEVRTVEIDGMDLAQVKIMIRYVEGAAWKDVLDDYPLTLREDGKRIECVEISSKTSVRSFFLCEKVGHRIVKTAEKVDKNKRYTLIPK